MKTAKKDKIEAGVHAIEEIRSGDATSSRGEMRKLCIGAVMDEPEMPGEMPDSLWRLFQSMKDDKERFAEALRGIVRATKVSIIDRIKQL